MKLKQSLKIYACVFALGSVFCATMESAVAQGGWTIGDFAIDLQIAADGTLDVTETITADFPSPRHGIYREIPIRYAVGAHLYGLRFQLLGVDDGAGHARQTKTQYRQNLVRIRIGDPDSTVTGRHVYRIRYRVARAILWEGEHAVLRWNATGTEWWVPILRASVTVHLPRPIPESDRVLQAFTGAPGSRGKAYQAKSIDDRTVLFSTQELSPGEGITIDVAMPADAVIRPSWGRELTWWLSDNFVYGILLGILGLCVGTWFLRGRDLPGRETIVVQYEPPSGLRPAEVGTLVDERIDLRDISSTIIDLAVRGYLKIEEIDTGVITGDGDYRFVKLRGTDGLAPYEASLFNKIFGISKTANLSDLRHKFYPVLGSVRSKLYQSLTDAGYFDGNPSSIRKSFAIGGIVLLAVALGIAALVQYGLVGRIFWLPMVITATLSTAAILITSWFMPRKTRKGRIAWEQIAGLEEFISRAEVDDLQRSEKQGLFERLLPYAIAFGLADRWSKAFSGLYSQPPEWFQPLSTVNFTTARLMNSVNDSVRSMNHVFPSMPRSSGSSGGSSWSSGGFSGGSVGGGFGGGGGGGW